MADILRFIFAGFFANKIVFTFNLLDFCGGKLQKTLNIGGNVQKSALVHNMCMSVWTLNCEESDPLSKANLKPKRALTNSILNFKILILNINTRGRKTGHLFCFIHFY